MRRVVSIFGLCAAVLVLGILLERRGVLRTTVDHATAPSTAAPSRVGFENDPSEQVGDLASVPPTSPREAVPLLEPTSVTEDPCASVTAELQAALAANEVAGQEIRELREKLAEVTRDLNALQFPEDTPYGAFLASPEAKDITDPQLLVAFRALLDDFPVMLRPGEATWIAEHSKKGNGAHTPIRTSGGSSTSSDPSDWQPRFRWTSSLKTTFGTTTTAPHFKPLCRPRSAQSWPPSSNRS